jgi:putative glutamine amidotransferase
MKTTIAVTDTYNARLEDYLAWLRRFNPDICFVTLSCREQNIQAMDDADGVLLTGGADIDPVLFHVEDPNGLARNVDHGRDLFELAVVHRALVRGLPLLAICRGLQVVNVALRGTLILDLPQAGFDDHSNQNAYGLAHAVTVRPRTLLSNLTNKISLQVNTSHHQAIHKLGKGLIASALSRDGVIEAAEWEDGTGKPFFCLVQWHPECLADVPDTTASSTLAEGFLRAAGERRLALEK